MPISHGPVAMDERAATQDPGQIATQDAMDATAAMGEPLATQDPDDAERLERMAIALLEVLQFKASPFSGVQSTRSVNPKDAELFAPSRSFTRSAKEDRDYKRKHSRVGAEVPARPIGTPSGPECSPLAKEKEDLVRLYLMQGRCSCSTHVQQCDCTCAGM
eukprot:s3516_g4.t1